jgi:WD40 repeat protein
MKNNNIDNINKMNSIDQQILELRQKLKTYGADINIHNFKLKNNNYRERFENKKLKFCLSQKLSIKNNKKIEEEENINSQSEKITNFDWGGEGNAFSNRIVNVTNKGNVYLFNSDNGKLIYNTNFNSGILNSCAIEKSENLMFAVGGFDGSLNLNYMNIKTGKEYEIGLRKFTGHKGKVSSIQFMSTAYMVSASFDSNIILWDVITHGKIVNVYKGHIAAITGLDVNQINGNFFVTCSEDSTIKFWDIRIKNPCVGTFKADSSINCVKYLPGRLSTVAAGCDDGTVRIYDLETFKDLGIFKNNGHSINSIELSKSGGILFASSRENNTISIWSLLGSKETPLDAYEYHGGKGGISQISMNSEKNKIAFADRDEIIIIK